MTFEARLTGEAAALARPHAAMLERLPATFHASILIELREVADAVRRRARLPARAAGAPGRPGRGRRAIACSPRRRADRSRGRLRSDRDAGAGRVPGRGAGAAAQAAAARPRGGRRSTRSSRRSSRRSTRRSTRADAPRRLVVQIYGSGIAVQAEQAVEPLQAAAASACRWRSTARAVGRVPARAVRRRTTAAPTLFAAVGGRPARRRSTPGSSNRTRRCMRAPSGRALQVGASRDVDRPELRPPARLSRRR